MERSRGPAKLPRRKTCLCDEDRRYPHYRWHLNPRHPAWELQGKSGKTPSQLVDNNALIKDRIPRLAKRPIHGWLILTTYSPTLAILVIMDHGKNQALFQRKEKMEYSQQTNRLRTHLTGASSEWVSDELATTYIYIYFSWPLINSPQNSPSLYSPPRAVCTKRVQFHLRIKAQKAQAGPLSARHQNFVFIGKPERPQSRSLSLGPVCIY